MTTVAASSKPFHISPLYLTTAATKVSKSVQSGMVQRKINFLIKETCSLKNTMRKRIGHRSLKLDREIKIDG
jgi:hypothetical protein